VVKTQETLKIDMNVLKGTATSASTPDIRTWAVNVYHIEVKGKDYLDTINEVMYNQADPTTPHCTMKVIEA
jgi:hypothetical protein